MGLHILIVEDDPLFAVELEMLVKELGYSLITKVDNSGEALEQIALNKPDLVLMDIDIKGGMNGKEVANFIKPTNTPVVFITSYADANSYEEASEANMLAYLVKPVNKFSLQSTIKLALKHITENEQAETEQEASEVKEESFLLKDFFFFREKDLFVKVALDDICFFKAEGDYVLAVTSGNRYMARIKFSKIMELLSERDFLQVHRSYLANLNAIQSINYKVFAIQFSDELTINFSRRHQANLRSRLNHLS